jgi:hypothetical protein
VTRFVVLTRPEDEGGPILINVEEIRTVEPYLAHKAPRPGSLVTLKRDGEEYEVEEDFKRVARLLEAVSASGD